MAPALQIGRMSVPESVDAEWNAWYNGEYIPGYAKSKALFMRDVAGVVEGSPLYHLYEFEHDKASESADGIQREHSSQVGRMREAITMAAGSPGVYRRIYP